MRKRIVWLIAALLLAFALLYPLRGAISVGRNNMRLKKSITHIEDDAVALNAIVPFKWDALYTFASDAAREDIEKAIGVQSRLIRVKKIEDAVRLLFVKDGNVVCSICDQAKTLGYRIDFEGAIFYDDGAVFDVTDVNGIIILTHRKQ